MVKRLNTISFDKVLSAANSGTLISVNIYKSKSGKNKGNHMIDYKISQTTLSGSPLDNPTHLRFMDCLRTLRTSLINNDYATIELNYIVDARHLKFRVVSKKNIENVE